VDGTHRDPEIPRLRGLDGEYAVVRELGRGGTSVVYLARERELGRAVAIKVLHPALAADEETIERLLREARTLARLDHPRIVMLYGTRRLEDGRLALVMSYAGDETLRTRLRARGPFGFADAARVLRDIATALGHAHGHGVIHRDVKPENIYLDAARGLARLSDFGIAKVWDHDASLTLDGVAIGTPAYMSPEQIEGAPLDGRSDLYSLGLVGHEMLTGRRPWEGETLFGTIYKQKHEPLPPLAVLRPGIPDPLRSAIETALAKEPDRRWPDVEAFLDCLTGRRGRERSGTRGRTPLQMHPAEPASAPPPDCAPPAPPSDDALTIRMPRPADTPPRPLPTPTPAVVPAPAPAAEGPEPAPRGARSRRARVTAVALGAVVLSMGLGAIATARRDVRPVAEIPAPPVEPPAPPPSPARIVPLDEASPRGVAGTVLGDPLAVRVEGEAGEAIAGAEVQFTIVDGGGEVSPDRVATDHDGVARAAWTLGPEPGANALLVTVPQAEAEGVEARLEAVGTVGAPARLVVVRGDRQQGAPGSLLRDTVVLRVEDAAGRPISGATLHFRVAAGGGTIRGAKPESDDEGRFRAVWRLGPEEGANGVQVEVEGAPGVEVRLEARGSYPALVPRAGVAAGGTHSCALTRTGEVSCWGGNEQGQLGTAGGAVWRPTPAPVAIPEKVAAIATGLAHTCALGIRRAVVCWGGNERGQLGDGSRAGKVAPSAVAGGGRYSALAVGRAHSCALDVHGATFCWGANDHGQLGDGARADRAVPTEVRSSAPPFRLLSAGWGHTCALTAEGRAYCWGENGAGQLGDGTTTDRTAPTPVGGAARFRQITAGGRHSCAVSPEGALYCWGANGEGQLGSERGEGRPRPTRVELPAPVATASAGSTHTCALTREGAAYCWGRNLYGQLGDGTTTDRDRPAPVSTSLRFATIRTSGAHTCAATATGEHYCWGYNADGQLGDGTRTHQPLPVRTH
jgi:serine/threonine protein kinase/alpha-tubulin suppressor-like RCC1 family protein